MRKHRCKTIPGATGRTQRGFATLVTTVIILLVITLTTLYTANTVVFEQKVSANLYRAQQSLAAAQAGFDAALEYYNRYSSSNALSSTAALTSTLADGSSYDVTFCSVSTAAALTQFMNDPENCTQLTSFAGAGSIAIASVGLGDDATGRRVVSSLSAAASLLNENAIPGQPITAGGSVAITGNITTFNRYSNASVWSGGATGTGSNSVESYINDGSLVTPLDAASAATATTAATRAQLTNTAYPSVNNALLASKADLGLNSDILDGDPNLSTLSEDELFEAFFTGTQADIRAIAQGAGQLFTAIGDIDGKTGLMWVEGSASYGPFGNAGTAVGDVNTSAIVVIDGDVTLNGGTYYGLLFVLGNLTMGGNIEVHGAVISTGNVDKSGGTPIIVYDPEALEEPPEGFPNTRGVVASTWRDWGS